MNCSKCNYPLGEETKFCPNCGIKNEIGKRHCSECGNEYSPKKKKRPIALFLISSIAVILAISLTIVLFITPVQNIAGVKLLVNPFQPPEKPLNILLEESVFVICK